MKVHLVDGTYELFRAHFGAPASQSDDGREVGAARGLLRTLVSLLGQTEVTHVAVAFDHVIESFRNELFAGYKTGEGVDPQLLAQFSLAEDVAMALGLVVWPQVEFEADDAIASAAARWASEDAVEQIVICSPDKDLAQCVRGERIVLLDRRRRQTLDESAVGAKWGVAPQSMPDFLALVGDAADGIPGIPRWGAKSAATVLGTYRAIEDIPDESRRWSVTVRGAESLARSLAERRDEAILYKQLATLRTDVPLDTTLAQLEWRGPDAERLAVVCEKLGDTSTSSRLGL